jgi:hypothetical protein
METSIPIKIKKLERCPKGTKRNKKTGNCDKVLEKVTVQVTATQVPASKKLTLKTSTGEKKKKKIILVDEEPISEEPKSEEPKSEEPVTEEPKSEEPISEEPISEEPISEEPVTDV